MLYLLMCEGSNEEKLINLLLDNDKLKITRDDLIGRKPYNIRQLKNPVIKTELLHYSKPVIIYRIGDTQTDKLTIPKELKKIVLEQNIYKYCTKPEMEILLIINENLLSKYNKSKKSPKEFAEENIKLNGKYYDQTNIFLENYYGGKNIDKLVDNIIEYRRIKKHNKDELFLADLLKKM